MVQGTQQSILLIEADTALRRLISLGLQYRGMQVIEASTPADLLTLEAIPAIMVIDVDGNASNLEAGWSLLSMAQAHPHLSTLPVVVLAWENPLAEPRNHEQHLQLQRVTCLTKPFDARALHTTIERLLLASTLEANVALDALSETLFTQDAALTARYVQSTPAPSIWPLTTAGGLLIAFIGLMGILAFTIVGLSIMFVSLLLWTLGTGLKKDRLPMTATRVTKTYSASMH